MAFSQIQLRRGAASVWTSSNPTLAAGEVGFEIDTGKIKIGDGATAWTDLDYFPGVVAASALTGTIDRARLPTVKREKAVPILQPQVGDKIPFYSLRQKTLQQLTATLIGSSSPSVSWKLAWAADLSAAGTAAVTAGTTTTNTTTGQAVTAFDNAVIPAGVHVWAEITAVSGTVDLITISLDYEEAA